MSESREFYRVTLCNSQVIELQKEDVDELTKALEDEKKSAVVTLSGKGNNKMTVCVDHIVSIEPGGLVRREIRFVQA